MRDPIIIKKHLEFQLSKLWKICSTHSFIKNKNKGRVFKRVILVGSSAKHDREWTVIVLQRFQKMDEQQWSIQMHMMIVDKNQYLQATV